MNYTYKQIWLINIPVMMSILMEQLINITDAIFLGHVGEVELGASALAGIYYLAVYMLGFGFSIGLQVMIARRNGEQHYKETGRTFFQGLYFLSGMAVILCLLILLVSPFILRRLITSDEIYQAVIHYLDWRSFGLLFSFPFLAFRSFLVGITTTKALSVAAIMAICINIPFNYLLIFKLNLGISGAAMASSLAEFGAFIVLLLYMWVRVDKVKYGLKVVYDGKVLIKLLRISVWSMLPPDFQTVYKLYIIAESIHKNQHTTTSDKSYWLLLKENPSPTGRTIHTDKANLPLARAIRPLSSRSVCDCQNS